MASAIVARTAFLLRSTLVPRIASGVRSYADEPPIPIYDPAEGKIASKDVSMPDELGASVGIDRYELLQRAKGIEDPFGLKGTVRTPGTTKDNPMVVLSTEPERVIGCVCDEDSTCIRYTRMHLGETTRCYCGHFFKLIPSEEALQ